MERHHRVALPFAVAVTAAVTVDTVVLAATGQRTFLTDDEQQTTLAKSALVTLLLAGGYLTQAWVVHAEAARFARGNRVVRAARPALLTGLLMLLVGGLVVDPVADATGGAAVAASDAAAGLALLLTGGSAVAIGLATLRRNPLGVGARVLATILPVAGLSVLLALVAPTVASPVFLSVVLALGIAALGVGAPAAVPAAPRPLEPGRR